MCIIFKDKDCIRLPIFEFLHFVPKKYSNNSKSNYFIFLCISQKCWCIFLVPKGEVALYSSLRKFPKFIF